MKEWQQDDDEKFIEFFVSDLFSMWPTNRYNLSHLCSGMYKVSLHFLWRQEEHSFGIKKTFFLSKICPLIALSHMFKNCVCVSLPI